MPLEINVAQAVGAALAGGAVSGIGAVVTMKTAQAGLKQEVAESKRRLDVMERTMEDINRNTQACAIEVAKISGHLGIK